MLARGSVDHCGAGTAAIFGRSRDDPAAANPATPLLTLRWTFSAKRACVVIPDSEPDRLDSSPPPAPMGLRGVSAVAARRCAGTSDGSFTCPSANVRKAQRGGLAPKLDLRRPAATGFPQTTDQSS